MAKITEDDDVADDKVEVVEGAGEEGEVLAVDEPKKAAEQDERVAQSDDGEEDDHSESNDAEREARRLERRARKDRERATKERNRKELDFLRKRNSDLERRFSSFEQRQTYSEAAIIDDRVSQIDQHIKQAEEVYAAAVSQGKGDDAVEAQRIRDQLRDTRGRLTSQKETLARNAQQQRETPAVVQEREVPEELVRHATAWQAKNSWYKPDRSDQDSTIAGAVDDRLVAEGFDPESEEYWDELTNRVKKVLPHRYSQNTERRTGPAMANGGRNERSLKPGEVYVSPERKSAMIEAGVWDDPKLRVRYLKQYQKYDQEHGTSRA